MNAPNRHECAAAFASGVAIARIESGEWGMRLETYAPTPKPNASADIYIFGIKHCPFCGKYLGNEMEVCDG